MDHLPSWERAEREEEAETREAIERHRIERERILKEESAAHAVGYRVGLGDSGRIEVERIPQYEMQQRARHRGRSASDPLTYAWLLGVLALIVLVNFLWRSCGAGGAPQ